MIHFFSYHLVLARQSTRTTRAAGFLLTVRPTVFHPRYFISSEAFAAFIDRLDLTGKRVIDIGTGTGILALAAARAGAAFVVAADINPNAALNAADNARANGLSGRVSAVCSDLLAALKPGPLFDVILSSPPKHAGEPRNLADLGWHAGPKYRYITALFDHARAHLSRPAGLMVIDGVAWIPDLDPLALLVERAGFKARQVHEHSLYIESMIIYELDDGGDACESLLKSSSSESAIMH